ncbi:FMN-linked oxidoreductase [Thozetella sp. PMI_491]|nr:FMN-linked oxidoreductase [Thozetella sp. PMI_491]
MTSQVCNKVPIPRRGVDYRGKIVLAPMVRSGELPSRLLALDYGADLVWGPETVDYSMIGTTRRVNPANNIIEWSRVQSRYKDQEDPPRSVLFRVDPVREANRLIFQVGTADPERAVKAARLVAADVAGIDVNAGCPKPFSVHAGMGAALLQTPDKLCAILEALVKEIMPEFEIGISVKIRLLETPAKTEALVRRLVATGITGLTVHCRTTPMRPRERAIRGQLRMVADVCRDAGVACLMNGDVESRDSALKLIEEYGVDGAMIATSAETNSSCFRTQADGGLVPWTEVVEKYVDYAIRTENYMSNTKYLLSQYIPGKSPKYREICSCKTYTQICEVLGHEHLLERARDADSILGLAPVPKPKGTKGKKNISALAASGQMAQARTADGQPRRAKAERGPNVLAEAIQAPEPSLTSQSVSLSM